MGAVVAPASNALTNFLAYAAPFPLRTRERLLAGLQSGRFTISCTTAPKSLEVYQVFAAQFVLSVYVALAVVNARCVGLLVALNAGLLPVASAVTTTLILIHCPCAE